MNIIHPFQDVASSRDGSLVFGIIKNELIAFKKAENGSWSMVGQWIDELDRNEIIKQNVEKERARQLAENVSKKLKSNDGSQVSTAFGTKSNKVSIPGSGDYPIFSHLRNLTLSSAENLLVVCADSDKSVVIFNINVENTQNIVQMKKRQPYPKRPNALTISEDEKLIAMADKFGDVYKMDVDSEVTKIDGDIEPILGHVSMLTSVLLTKDSNGKDFIITSDRDEHIKITHYPQTFIVKHWLFGHQEFVSSLFLPQWDKTNSVEKKWLFSAGGDDQVYLWNWEKNEKISEFNYKSLLKEDYINDNHLAPERFQNDNNDVKEFCVSNIVTLPTQPIVAFFVEATPLLIVLECDLNDGSLKLLETIEFESNIVSLTTNENGLVLSFDNRDNANKNFIKILTFNQSSNKFVTDEELSKSLDSAIEDSLKNDQTSHVDSNGVYPLYTAINLKKHGDHYS